MADESRGERWTALTQSVEDELAAWRTAHPLATLTEIELAVEAATARLRRQLIADLAQGVAETTAAVAAAAPPVCPRCGGVLRRRGKRPRTVVVAHQAQPVRLERDYFWCPTCRVGLSPLDETLGLGPGELSPRLVEALVRLGAKLPFAQAADEVGRFWGVWVSEDTVRRLTETAGAAYVAVQDAEVAALEHALPEPPQGAAVVQVSTDGAMVPLVHGEWAEVKTLAIGTVGTVPSAQGAAVRTIDLSYFSRLTGSGDFVRLARGEVHRRGIQTAGQVLAINDGSPWTQNVVAVYRPDAVRILDFPHPVQHLNLAAQAVWGSGTDAGRTWLSRQAHALKHEGALPVLSALRALPVAEATDPLAAAKVQAETLGYLEARLDELRYPWFVAQGWPIGDGAVESANKLVVEARLKGSGMHWTRSHVNPMVALRTALCSQRWDAVWSAIHQEARRQAQQQHRAHLAARQPPVPTPVSAPAPARRMTRSAVLQQLRAATPPKIVNGRPTADHPWRKPLKCVS